MMILAMIWNAMPFLQPNLPTMQILLSTLAHRTWADAPMQDTVTEDLNMKWMSSISPSYGMFSIPLWLWVHWSDHINWSCSLRSHDHPWHLLLYGMQEYDTKYLQALLDNNWEVISKHEHDAKLKGYGPLMPCDYVASSSMQTQLCHT